MPTVSTDSAKRALFEHLVDDAGLFPPAQLPMRAALRHHARHRESAYWWVAGRFVVPASRLAELAAARDAAQALDLSVILDAATTAKGDTVRADIARVERTVHELDGVSVSSLELRVPGGLDEAGLRRALTSIAEFFTGRDVSLWYETAYDGGWQSPPGTVLPMIAAVRATAPAHVTLGAKIRCGGAVAGATPSVPDLAAFVIEAHAHDVPWKATAGLHHPVRGMHGVAKGVVPHGFLNLFIAGAALHASALDASRIAGVLDESDPRAFVVDPAHAGWRDVTLDAEQIAAARERCVAFGSCSFDEPVNDLRELGILS